jgi:hypothetical protein
VLGELLQGGSQAASCQHHSIITKRKYGLKKGRKKKEKDQEKTNMIAN